MPTIMELYPNKFRVVHPTECWVFTGALNKGYGVVKYNGKTVAVHRLSAHLSLGLDLSNPTIYVCHKPLCLTECCANPEHLYLGSNSTNQKDSVLQGHHNNARKIYCKRGHLLSDENVYIIPSTGSRQCKICKRNKEEE